MDKAWQSIGVDFGSDSVRAILVDCESGEVLSSSVSAYSRWKQWKYSDASASRFRQHPLDYLESLVEVILNITSGRDTSLIRGIGIDMTGSPNCAGISMACRQRGV